MGIGTTEPSPSSSSSLNPRLFSNTGSYLVKYCTSLQHKRVADTRSSFSPSLAAYEFPLATNNFSMNSISP